MAGDGSGDHRDHRIDGQKDHGPEVWVRTDGAVMSRELLFKRSDSIDGRSYQRYSEIVGSYDMGQYSLHIDDHGSVSRPASMRVSVSLKDSGFPDDTYSNRSREIALRDLISRRFWESCRTDLKNAYIPRPGQEILERGSVRIYNNGVAVAFSFDLPVKGKNIPGNAVKEMFGRLDAIVSASLFFRSYKRSKVYDHIHTSENADVIRSSLSEHGMAAFIANGSILPRREDGLAPMIDAVPFTSPKEMEVSFDVPNGPPITGMGVPRGITAVIGSTGSGKTVLTDAIVSGVHNHIPGDGREMVITSKTAMCISSSKGRHIENIDASSFMNLPEASRFSSRCVSGAVSQSVAIAEAAEIGCDLFILDEGSSHPSIINIDGSIREIISEEQIKPLTEMSEALSSAGISVIAATNSGGFVTAADTIVRMRSYVPSVIPSKPLRQSAGYREPEPRYPIMPKNAVLSVGCIPEDIVIPKDISYPRSVIRMIERISPDGTMSMCSIFKEDQNLGPEDVAVRGSDAAMLLSRIPAVSMIRRS